MPSVDVASERPQLPRQPRPAHWPASRLVADGSVAAATPCQEVLALSLTAGASGLDHNPLKARVGSSTGSALLLCPQAGAIGNRQSRHFKEVHDDDGEH